MLTYFVVQIRFAEDQPDTEFPEGIAFILLNVEHKVTVSVTITAPFLHLPDDFFAVINYVVFMYLNENMDCDLSAILEGFTL